MNSPNKSVQKINLKELDSMQTGGRKASRIELRLLRDAYSLHEAEFPEITEKNRPDIQLKRVTAYCTASSYDLKKLYKFFKKSESAEKVQMYFGECLYVSCEGSAIFFMDYGVTVAWGLDEQHEQTITKLIKPMEILPYDLKSVEIENFEYGIAENSQIVNDKIYLKDENFVTKMVLSIAIAQSVKLDCFEELVEDTVEAVKDLPDEVEKEGTICQTRRELLKILGKLHKLSFNLNLVSNILDEPEFIWHFSAYSNMYETCLRYLDIKSRADILNKRCEIIYGILEILNENITTHNSELFKGKIYLFLILLSFFSLIHCILLAFIVYKGIIKK
ncbi:hypothetical protein NUSPORA_01184 [Nucleospora cyclopteri]